MQQNIQFKQSQGNGYNKYLPVQSSRSAELKSQQLTQKGHHNKCLKSLLNNSSLSKDIDYGCIIKSVPKNGLCAIYTQFLALPIHSSYKVKNNLYSYIGKVQIHFKKSKDIFENTKSGQSAKQH